MIFCFGELLLRMSPVLGRQWIHDASIPVFVGGAELNAATALACWDMPVAYGTALPDHYLTREILEELKSKKIDTSRVLLRGDRIGSYYLPQGKDLKNEGVIYDRAHSSFWNLKPGEIDWNMLLKDCTWFHFSAISPALNQDVADVCLEGVKAAKSMGLTVSVDLNYRAKLWKYGKKPVDVMPELVKYCDVIMGNIWAAEQLLGIPVTIDGSIDKTNEELLAAAERSIDAVRAAFPEAKHFAYTFRLEHDYWAVYKGGDIAASPVFAMDNVVDKIGSGDCFMAGLIYGISKGHTSKEIIGFAAAAAVGKLGEKGDATRQTIEDVKRKLATGVAQ